MAPKATAVVHFADVILRARGFGFAGNTSVPPIHPSAWELLDPSEADIKEMLKEAKDGLLEEAAELSLALSVVVAFARCSYYGKNGQQQ